MAPPHPPSEPGRSPWRWIPTLYFGQGLPYVAVMMLAVVMYKNLGVSNTDIALLTSWLYLPWVIKPLWGPLVDLLGRKRVWIVALQFTLGASLALVALVVPAPAFLQLSLALFWLMAFASATHDIAADGFYMLALPHHRQAAYVGVRSTFYRLAMIAGQGGLVMLAGWLQQVYAGEPGGVALAWRWVFLLLAGLFVLMALWHAAVLPRPQADQPAPRVLGSDALLGDALAVFAAFFRQPGIARILAFLLLYRLGEAQLLKLVAPFVLDARAQGGLGLSTQALGLAYGTAGMIALTLGGLLGGWVISRLGLKRALWPLLAAMHLPNLVYVALAWAQPHSLWLVSAAIAVEQFGYGLGFTAYMVFMLMVAERPGMGEASYLSGQPRPANPHATAHYALCTGFMALGMMLPGMASGWLQSLWGYTGFFAWVCLATLPSLLAAALLRIPAGFGRRDAAG